MKKTVSRAISLFLAFLLVAAAVPFSPPALAADEMTELYRFTFDPADKAAQESLFVCNPSSQAQWVSTIGQNDSHSLKMTHIPGTTYTGAENAVRLTLPAPLPAGGIYNISVYFRANTAENPGKGTLTGPGVVLNGEYANGAYKLPSAPGTLAKDTWKEVNVNTPRMEVKLTTIDFRLVVNDAPNHPDVWYIDSIVISRVGDLEAAPEWDLTLPSLAETYKDYFLLSNVMEPTQTLSEETTGMYTHHYNAVTPENCMKPASISTAKGGYNFSGADMLVAWAAENDIAVHGHALVWHSQSPDWLYKTSGGAALTRAEARANMEEYVSTVAGHFSGKLLSWDVVNEAFDGGSGTVTNWKTVLRTSSPWYAAYANGADTAKGESGADYIYDAFVFARLADPDATLYYNDYNETDTWKYTAIALMAEELNAKWKADPRNTDPGRPLVEGAGMQAHYYTGSMNITAVENAIKRFVQAGLVISVTELDIPYGTYSNYNNPTLTQAQLVTQAVWYARLFEVYRTYSDNIERVTIWGKTDSQSWRAQGCPVLFDARFNAKEAYYGVVNPYKYLSEHGETPKAPVTGFSSNIGTIVAGLPANIPVSMTGNDLKSVSVRIVKGGEPVSPAVPAAAKLTLRIDAAPAAGSYEIAAFNKDGVKLASVPLKVVDLPTDIWTVKAVPSGGKLSLLFGAEIAANLMKVTIDGAEYAVLSADGRRAAVDFDYPGGPLNIVVSGVRFPELFPSYSFTFKKVECEPQPELAWVGTWASGQYYGDTTSTDGGTRDAGTVALTLPNSTFRQIIRTSVGGSQLRLTFSNEYGATPMTINAASVARANGANNTSNIDISTNTAVTFNGGEMSVTIQPGKFAVSDPIDFPVDALERIAVSTYFGAMPTRVSAHIAARGNSYLLRNTDATLNAVMTGATTPTNWFVLCNADVLAPAENKSIVLLGDSITDGYGVTNEKYTRWADVLMNNLQANPDTSHLSVINMGIGTNCLLTGTNPLAAKDRFERDVLNQPSVGYVVFLIGVNDLPGNAQTVSAMTAAFDNLFKAAAAKGIKVYGGTISPRGSTSAQDANRRAVNDWIRQQYAQGNIYGLADFDELLRNPANPAALLPAYMNDSIHPSEAGYKTMGEYVYSLILEDMAS